ncbi:hypothetical protein ABW19_dt0209019 [Dactylella cylindrospora]|nr:hypothetical protein ABW19_dt0209019 [Dactylella cylindrospora]
MQSTPVRPPSPDAGVAHILTINYFDPEEQKWNAVYNSAEAGFKEQPRANFALVTWNVDFDSPEPQNRIDTAMSYLRSLLVTATDAADTISPVIIVLQEVSHEMIKSLAENEWVQQNFYITDVSTDDGLWQRSHYGTVTLVDRRINVQNVIRLHYDSDYYRDCLFVDVEAARTITSENVTVRIGNTHLESLKSPIPKRPAQLKLAAQFVLYDQNVFTGIVAGDMNPIEAFDANLPAEVGLKDAYLETGGKENDPRGHTWGYQPEQNEYPKRRFDKILYAPGGRMKIEQVQPIGIGQKTLERPKVFISDHYGVFGFVRIL